MWATVNESGRAERVDRAEELGLARRHHQRRDAREDRDRDVGRLEARVDPAQELGKLAVHAHREGEPREPDQRSVGRDQQDHRSQDPDVDPERVGQPGIEADVLDDPEHRVVGVGGPELGRVVAGGVLGHRHRRERDGGQERVQAEHGQDRRADAARDGPRRVPRLLGHVRDRLDPRVGDHPDRDPEREVAPASAQRRGRPASTSRSGSNTSARPMTTSTAWVSRSAIASTKFRRADSSVPLMLSSGEQRHQPDAEEHVARAPRRAAPRTPPGSAARRRPRSRP